MKSTLCIRGGTLVEGNGTRQADLLIEDGSFRAIGTGLEAPPDAASVDATGKLLFAGLTDPQVHFREPGLTHKEDLASGSLAALGGGVTGFMEMPNTKPPTIDPARLKEKLALAKGRCYSDHAFFLGATKDNAEQLGEWERAKGCAGVKIFMGSSTGDLLVPDDETLERILRSGERRVAVHSEDEYRLRELAGSIKNPTVFDHPRLRDVECALRSTTRLLDLVEKTGRKVHLLHVTTKEEIALLRERQLGDLVTVEITPNHLFLEAPSCYEAHGSLAQMNPPIRDRAHLEVLREAVKDGTVTCIGSDHAAHTRGEKEVPYPGSPSGIPGVQSSLGLLLTAVRDGWLELPDVARICAEAPVDCYGILGKGRFEAGNDADVCMVDPSIEEELPVEWLHSKTGFSPFEGWKLSGWPERVWLRGVLAYEGHAPVGEARGRPLRFAQTD